MARLADAEFAVAIPLLNGATPTDLAGPMLDALSRPVSVDHVPFNLRPVAGVAVSPDDGDNLSTILSRAEIALIEARAARRSEILRSVVAEVVLRRAQVIPVRRHLEAIGRDGGSSSARCGEAAFS